MNLNNYVEVKFNDILFQNVVQELDTNIVTFNDTNLESMNIPVYFYKNIFVEEFSDLNIVDCKIKVKEEKRKRVIKKSKTKKTKVQLMVELIREFPNLSRLEYIELGVEREISSRSGCSTFYNTAKNLI